MAYYTQKKEHDYKSIERDLADAVFDEKNVVLLYGHEDYLVRSYEKRLKDIFVEPAAEELDHVKLEGGDITVDDIISHCDTLPMLSGRRVVSISDYPALKNSKGPSTKEDDKTSEVTRLAGYLENIPSTTLIIFTNDSISKSKSLYKRITKVGKAYDFDRLDRTDLASFIKKRFKAEGKIADSAVIREIMNITGYFDRDSEYDLNGIAGDVVKISSFSHEDKITQSDVSSVLVTSLETDSFALMDSISAGNRSEAMLLVNNILENGENSFRLLGLVISQYELMLGIREFSERNMDKAAIMNEMGIKSDFRYRKVSGYLGQYSTEKLYDTLKKLYDV